MWNGHDGHLLQVPQANQIKYESSSAHAHILHVTNVVCWSAADDLFCRFSLSHSDSSDDDVYDFTSPRSSKIEITSPSFFQYLGQLQNKRCDDWYT